MPVLERHAVASLKQLSDSPRRAPAPTNHNPDPDSALATAAPVKNNPLDF